jgi:hypothetical protein
VSPYFWAVVVGRRRSTSEGPAASPRAALPKKSSHGRPTCRLSSAGATPSASGVRVAHRRAFAEPTPCVASLEALLASETGLAQATPRDAACWVDVCCHARMPFPVPLDGSAAVRTRPARDELAFGSVVNPLHVVHETTVSARRFSRPTAPTRWRLGRFVWITGRPRGTSGNVPAVLAAMPRARCPMERREGAARSYG